MNRLPTRRSKPISSKTTWRRWIRRTSASSIRSPAATKTAESAMLKRCSAVLAILAVLAAPLLAQTINVTGRVLTVDSTPVPGNPVVLHRVGSQMQGPIDSTRSTSAGRFRLSFQADTSAFYLVSTQYAGIEYFSKPVSTIRSRPDPALVLVVYDTSSTAPVSLEARNLVVTRAGQDGSRNVLDLMVIQNKGRLTR